MTRLLDNRNNVRFWTRVFLTIVIFVAVFKVVEIVALSAVGRVLVDMESEQATIGRLYFSRDADKPAFNPHDVSHGVAITADGRKEFKFDLDNSVVKQLRLDPGTVPGVYKIYKITPLGFFGELSLITPFAENLVISAGPGTIATKKADHLEVVATNNDPYVIFEEQIKSDYYFLPVFSASVMAFIFFTISENFQLTECHFWQDTFTKSPSSGTNYTSLDGFRGLAALFVLASHTGLPGGDHLGMTGVVMFFALSGFLLTMPYAKDPQRVTSFSYVKKYFSRRFRRIVPMFYFIITVAYLFHGRIEDFVRSAFFLQGNSIMWTVLQEIHFYVFLPAILLFNFWICRGNRWIIVVSLFVLSFCFNHSIFISYPIYGLGGQIRVYAGIFLSGIMFCFLYHIDAVRHSRVLQKVLSNPFVSLSLLFFLVATAHVIAWLHGGRYDNPTWQLLGNFNYFVSFILMALLLAENSPMNRILSLVPFRLLGTVSYSFYLLHPTCVQILKQISSNYFYHTLDGVTKFVLSLILTFFVSTITYTLIERPCKG